MRMAAEVRCSALQCAGARDPLTGVQRYAVGVRTLMSWLMVLASLAHAGEDVRLGDGHDGPLRVEGEVRAERGGVVTVEAPAGAGALQVQGSSARSGDLLLLWRSTGQAPADDAGVRADLSDLGTFELRRVLEVRGETVTLLEPLARATPVGTQVVRVIEATTVEVVDGGRLLAPPFDGRTGGVVAVFATGGFVNDGLVSATGAGFRGGVASQMTSTRGCTGDLSPPPFATMQGRSPLDPTSTSTGRAANGPGGGGGVCRCSGGGGGAHVGRGGEGGGSNDGARAVGGHGGLPLVSTPGTQLFFGGGGGAGWTDWDVFTVSSGAAGGGLVFLRAASFSGRGRYEADGEAAGSYGGIDYGLGGGGAGGTVVLASVGPLSCGLSRANGGRGGGGNNFAGGTGGGGGGGRVILQGLRGAGDCPGEALAGPGGTSFVPGSPGSSTAPGFVGSVSVITQAFAAPIPPRIEAPANGAEAEPTIRVMGVAPEVEQVRLFVDRRAVMDGAVTDGRFSFDVARPEQTGVVLLEVAGLRQSVEVSRSEVVHVLVRAAEAGPFHISSEPSATASCGVPWRYDDDGLPTLETNDVVTWSLEPAPGGLAPLRSTIDPATGAVRWTPTLYDQGTVTFDLVGRAGTREARQRVTVQVDCRASVGCGCTTGSALWWLPVAVLLLIRRRT